MVIRDEYQRRIRCRNKIGNWWIDWKRTIRIIRWGLLIGISGEWIDWRATGGRYAQAILRNALQFTHDGRRGVHLSWEIKKVGQRWKIYGW